MQHLFSLASTPPANDFVPKTRLEEKQPEFPLRLHACNHCGHVQLLDIVDADLLFRNYVYVSSTSPVFVEHFRAYAASMLEYTAMQPGSTVLDIGSNDGALLQCFKQAGMRVLGIDPARKIAEEATRKGIETRPEFFTETYASRLKAEGYGNATVIAANNVFAHADDLRGIARGVRHLLADDGVFVFEVSYLVDVFQKTLFDTIYHEHLSYHSVKPLQRFFASVDMELIDAIRVNSHGGSLRGIAQKRGGPYPVHGRVAEWIQLEEQVGLYKPETYRVFYANINRIGADLRTRLTQFKAAGKRIIGFGAPAKATTLMYHFQLDNTYLDAIIDDSPWKQGLYSPGLHIPVVASDALYASPQPDFALILAWNFAEPIMQKHQAFRERGGRFIIPLPEIRVC
jgi:SAM-dependent methyltransferase